MNSTSDRSAGAFLEALPSPFAMTVVAPNIPQPLLPSQRQWRRSHTTTTTTRRKVPCATDEESLSKSWEKNYLHCCGYAATVGRTGSSPTPALPGPTPQEGAATCSEKSCWAVMHRHQHYPPYGESAAASSLCGQDKNAGGLVPRKEPRTFCCCTGAVVLVVVLVVERGDCAFVANLWKASYCTTLCLRYSRKRRRLRTLLQSWRQCGLQRLLSSQNNDGDDER